MKNPETTTVFAGVDGRADAQLPEWYARQTSIDDLPSFSEALRALPRAIETEVAFHNPTTDSWVPTRRFNALIDPERLRTDASAVDSLFHIPTTSYSIINPSDVYGPLEAVLRDEQVDGTPLGDLVFGEIRQYRGGGEVHMDLLFDGLAVTLPDRRDPITMGITSGYDFFGGHAVYVEGFARDTQCANSIRQLTNRKTVKHVGDVRSFDVWWEQVLGQLGLVADDLLAFIEEAAEITVEFTAVPFDVTEFYELLGFPTYLAERASSDARANATDPFEIDVWTLHSGATYALTHFFTGSEGSALDRYVRTANDILFNPNATIETVEQTYEQQAIADTDEDGQTGLTSQTALAQIEYVGADIREKARQFNAREMTLRERFAQDPTD